MHKGQGLVRDVFRTRNMRSLWGNTGIGHVRYPTAGSASSLAEAQPFYVNSPFGIVLAHNGNLTNDSQLKDEMYRTDLRHINTNSDSEALLNVFAHELQKRANGFQLDQDIIFLKPSPPCTSASKAPTPWLRSLPATVWWHSVIRTASAR